ncbi:Delta-aminolevulinic acid dehydratase [Terricaulis silvestris]|uniref:Delta-aminolevulinic acid dehydratase n=1 Tax=Terricaulis silvestris TaxID=2686094 RepID=A0A6I6MLM7_9CAUL|nr:Delta-aminolevulinic acid dehydratase [Terricaulis silvestris]
MTIARYPASRSRRLRQSDWARRLTREHALSPDDLIWAIVVHDGAEDAIEVASMPSAPRLSIRAAAAAAKRAEHLGIPALAIFPHIEPAKKDSEGREALNPDGLVCRTVRALKDAAPSVGIMVDVALDPFTDHGHDGLVQNGQILNDATIELLVEQAIIQVEAGADIVAPSDMMDGRVGAIRHALEAGYHHDTLIMSYAAKYASHSMAPTATPSVRRRLVEAPITLPAINAPISWIVPMPMKPSAKWRWMSQKAPTCCSSSQACPISTSSHA